MLEDLVGSLRRDFSSRISCLADCILLLYLYNTMRFYVGLVSFLIK